MKTEELKIKYPSGFEHSVHMTKVEMEQHIRLMAALKMFELGKISSGKAAELAGMSRVEFFEACGRYRVSIFNYPAEEAEEEIKKDLEEDEILIITTYEPDPEEWESDWKTRKKEDRNV